MAALACGALLLPGCGGGNDGRPIPASTADRLIRNIQAADQYSSDGSCARAHRKVRDARFVLGQVPRSVDADVRRGISDGLTRLDSLITNECQRTQTTETETTPTETETTQTETTETETTPTETTPTETTPTTTTPTQTTPTTTTPTQTSTTTTGTGGTPPGEGAQAEGQG